MIVLAILIILIPVMAPAEIKIFEQEVDLPVAPDQSQNQVERGSIFFTAKDGTLISAATIASGDTIAMNPQKLLDPAAGNVGEWGMGAVEPS